MLGYMSSATVGVAPLHGRPNQFWLASYFQDDYKVSTNLTVNLGIRYDYFQPWKEMRDHWASFDLAANQLVYAANAPEAQGGRALRSGDTNNWGPRFGFAWRPLGRKIRLCAGVWSLF